MIASKPSLRSCFRVEDSNHFVLSQGAAMLFFMITLATPSQLVLAQTVAGSGWTKKFDGIGIFSSPRLTDLNSDGVLDIVFGTGREEFKACDSAVIALDGRSGEMLWHVAAPDHLYTSAALKDLNADGVEDVFMAGRSAELMAIDGKSGKVIWKFDRRQGGVKWFNFYNPQFVKDQDHDGIDDILISNGGNVMAAPFEKKLRYPGYLAVISGKTGKLIAKAQMPDGNETYMSISALPIEDGKDYKVIFGTGGETFGGSLYVTTLSQVLTGNLSNSILLDSSPDKGYIGPPLWVDITGDDTMDIVANAVEGKLVAFDGNTYQPIWSVKVPETEAYSSVAPGYFSGDDNVPDFFVSYAVGTWPDLGWSKQIMVNGATGETIFMDSLGSYQTSTPVVIDLDGDGVDEAILNVNVQTFDFMNKVSIQNILVVVNFRDNEVLQVWDGYPGSNISSTPWIGDMDKDGMLDIIYCHGTNITKTYSFDGIQVNRLSTGIPIQSSIRWGGYMGNNFDGIFWRK